MRKSLLLSIELSYPSIPGPCYANQCLNPTHLNLCIILVLPPTKTYTSVSSELYLLFLMRTISKSQFFLAGIFNKSKIRRVLNSSFNPYIKVKSYRICVFVSVCFCVPKDLAKHWTDMVLLYSSASHRSWKGILLF